MICVHSTMEKIVHFVIRKLKKNQNKKKQHKTKSNGQMKMTSKTPTELDNRN